MQVYTGCPCHPQAGFEKDQADGYQKREWVSPNPSPRGFVGGRKFQLPHVQLEVLASAWHQAFQMHSGDAGAIKREGGRYQGVANPVGYKFVRFKGNAKGNGKGEGRGKGHPVDTCIWFSKTQRQT